MRTALLIDDEPDLVEMLRYNLEKENFKVVAASDGVAGLHAAQQLPDVIVLDVMMPKLDGFEVCKRLRASEKTAQIPIIMLTARAAETDKVVGLELGADDYVTKPFSPRELVARIKALLRRSMPQPDAQQIVRRGKLGVDLSAKRVTYEDIPVAVTATEFRILHLLASRAGKVLTRDEIIDGALGRDVSIFDRTIDVHITSLRKKLGEGGEKIETVRGFGYRLADADA
jgi:two-component system phosphate regulon response regulator PhoB